MFARVRAVNALAALVFAIKDFLDCEGFQYRLDPSVRD